MILALDQGTTGSTAIVFDAEGRAAGRAYSEFGQHFPRPGWVEHDANEIWEVTRRVGREALDAAGIDGRELRASASPTSARPWWRGIARAASRCTARWCGRTAAPPQRCDELREAGHEPLVRERTGLVLDPYFSGTKIEWLIREGDVDPARARVRHDRLVAGLQAHRAPRHRLLERLADAALRHRRARVGPRAVRPARRARRLAARALPERPRLRRDGRVRRQRARGGNRGRPAGRALRPGLPHARPRQEHLRHRQLRAPERRRRAARAARRAAHHRRLGGRRPRGLRAGGRGLRDRRGRAVAARRPRRDRQGGGDRGAGALAGLQRRRLPGARVHGPRLAALGSLRARHDRRASPAGPAWRTSRARRSRRSPTRPSTRCGRWRRPRAWRSRS